MICKGSFVHNFSSSPIWKFWHSKEHLQNLRENLDDQHSVLTSCVTSERVPYNRSDKRSWFLKFQLDLTTLTGYNKYPAKILSRWYAPIENYILGLKLLFWPQLRCQAKTESEVWDWISRCIWICAFFRRKICLGPPSHPQTT